MTSTTTISIDLDTLTIIVGGDESMKVSKREALGIISVAYQAELARRGHDDVETVVSLTSGTSRSTYEDSTIHDRVLCDGADALRAAIVA